ncbi:hypothetical protein AOLI_G00177010 [Acnodon oligacanthus]
MKGSVDARLACWAQGERFSARSNETGETVALVVGRPTVCHPGSEGDGHAGQGRSEQCVKLADEMVTSPLQDLKTLQSISLQEAAPFSAPLPPLIYTGVCLQKLAEPELTGVGGGRCCFAAPCAAQGRRDVSSFFAAV